MAGAIKDLKDRIFGKDPREPYWTCPRCRTQNALSSPFCLKCAETEEQQEAEKVRLETDSNPMVNGIVQMLTAYLNAAQIPSREVAQEAEKAGIRVNAPQEIALAPAAALDTLADRFINYNRTMATGSGAVMGMPGGLLMLATIPTDLSAITYYSFRMISGIAQTYGSETRSEEGRAIALLLYAGAQGIEQIKVGGDLVLLASLTKNLLTKPYRDMIMKRVIREVAKEIGVGLARRTFNFIPVVGGVVGATANYMFMSNLAARAKNYYRQQMLDMREKSDAWKNLTPPTPIKPAQPAVVADNPAPKFAAPAIKPAATKGKKKDSFLDDPEESGFIPGDDNPI
jgi:EcsC protein family